LGHLNHLGSNPPMMKNVGILDRNWPTAFFQWFRWPFGFEPRRRPEWRGGFVCCSRGPGRDGLLMVGDGGGFEGLLAGRPSTIGGRPGFEAV